MFKSILVPFDGSQGAQTALRKALELRAICGECSLTLLTVYRHHSMLEASISMVGADQTGNLDEIMRGHAKEVAENGKAIAAKAGYTDVRAFVKSGPTARVIVSFAQEHQIDLIVIGSRGLGSFEGYLLGSVSHKVTGLAACPVMVV
ncbi:universal stress protein [Falsihalocynthiibacter arcticus]|uniref:Universal stress protein UspA n=1 Tax=Falsihalocynthiibacter arcticus TaxID=1579316 RepID=A0A126V5B8_9RHOB|nr:universal stress protein [Falsihalocynthiibacter arcticus]AML52899.1 universal stress protein UspA [Falsihalocynthiibacter arcticus]